ncbi:hypothetical protein KTE71_22655 [Burkholderia multivorans]|uniref:hypothetical protein n=1 Tax=Burkholderia multivorans TaxID=87883 RepID=UPI0004F8E758|nr:hypothetical protein [Burkholderia multivorans]AIO76545.1 hypothetical protein DM80_1840 [Burkholderia multivorans]AOK68879.1 hypothetical protein WM33_25785 [Burkholderia multivorans]KVZ73269.1 hypothetical protein WL23_29660 [Burkholderia multivorans]MBU9226395.1 hypothetical protein [Burkholderia multivorans]MBU9390309.1 hypothetical protein [Burkholderia multivorans]
MYEINRNLIERKADRSFFDAAHFFVFKFNANGYAIIDALSGGPFPRERFVALCDARKMAPEAIDAFWDKCMKHRIVVEPDGAAIPDR